MTQPLTSPGAAQPGRSAVVGTFDNVRQAQAALQALEASGVPSGDLILSEGVADVASLLGDLGVPDGETRFYAQEVDAGRALLAVRWSGDPATVRELIVQYGGSDVQSRGSELARSDGAGVPGGTGPRPATVTEHWEDVASRYEMLWQQHFGTTDATWEQMQPIYRYAWYVANEPAQRGRPWAEVEAGIRHSWEAANPSAAWDDVAEPIRDVWEDVAADATTFAEGGEQRNIPPRE